MGSEKACDYAVSFPAFPFFPMGYNDSRSGYATVISLWRVFVPSERVWDRTVRELPAMLKPEKESFYRPRVTNKTGHQVDLVQWELTVDESQLPFSYPDW
jgi:hypothetical protein